MPRTLGIYSVQRSGVGDQLVVEPVFAADGEGVLAAEYTSVLPLTIGGSPHLIGYDRGSAAADVYQLTDGAPWLTPAGKLEIGTGWEIVEPLVIGNQPHLMCYREQGGQFGFFAVSGQLAPSSPYVFSRAHEPGVTAGFTTAKNFTWGGKVAFLGYNGKSGYVAIYTLSVTATSPPGVPPLLAASAWSHQWAKGWTRFAFFQLGGANFFLKTNTWRPNVNIDHIADNLSDGTSEVASQLDLVDAQQLDVVQPLVLGSGDPYFIAYKRDGATVFYRFNGDCRGWTKVGEKTTVAGATQLAPVAVGSRILVIIC